VRTWNLIFRFIRHYITSVVKTALLNDQINYVQTRPVHRTVAVQVAWDGLSVPREQRAGCRSSQPCKHAHCARSYKMAVWAELSRASYSLFWLWDLNSERIMKLVVGLGINKVESSEKTSPMTRGACRCRLQQ
jgi:hypothetical protein